MQFVSRWRNECLITRARESPWMEIKRVYVYPIPNTSFHPSLVEISRRYLYLTWLSSLSFLMNDTDRSSDARAKWKIRYVNFLLQFSHEKKLVHASYPLPFSPSGQNVPFSWYSAIRIFKISIYSFGIELFHATRRFRNWSCIGTGGDRYDF